MKEEQQIQSFVHRVSTDEELRNALVRDPDMVMMREGFSPRVAQIISRLVPHLAVERELEPSFSWWR